jgi:hypothetical protein
MSADLPNLRTAVQFAVYERIQYKEIHNPADIKNYEWNIFGKLSRN